MRVMVAGLLLLLSIESFPQQKLSEGEQEVKNKAYQFFDDDNYAEALPLFSRLLSLYPKDMEYNYAYGVCLIEENKDSDKALSYLNYVLKNIEKPAALYYIGRIWHMKYKFDEALKFYNQFKEKAKKEDLKKYPADRQVQMCNSGKELIRYVSILNVEVNKIVKSKDFYYSYEIDDFGGKILVKPNENKSKVDKKKEKNSENKSLMFLSTELNVLYYSSYGENDKNGKDIYRQVKDNASGSWLPAENLGPVINTPFDEDFPYIHPDGQTLYFASKGHNSMGGYDIFKSTYDWATNTWSPPVNLDFPTNSPYDDYLYISDAKEDIAYFASNRETGMASVSVYRIKIDKNPKKKEIENFEEIIKKSKLEVTAPLIGMKTRDEDIKMEQVKDNAVAVNNSGNVEKGKYTFPEISLTESLTAEEVYKEAENDAGMLDAEAKAADRDANIVLILSDKKNKEANEKRKEEETSRNAAAKLKDKDAKETEIKNADRLKEDADQLAKEAVLAYNLAMNLKNIADDKKKDAKDASDFSKELSYNKNKKLREIVEAVNASRKKINERQKNYTSVEKELLKSKISINETSQLVTNKSSELENVKTSLSDLDIRIKSNREKIQNEINTATKIKLENEAKGWENDVSNKKRQEYQLNFEITQLNLKLKNTNKDIAFYQHLIDEINSNKEEYAKAEQNVTKIDNTKLVKEINDKKTVVEKQFAEIKITEPKTDEQVVSENTKIEKDKNLLVSNENYNQLVTEAKISERIADSLHVVIEKARKNLEKIKDPKKKEDEKNRLNNLQTIAEFKKQDAEAKYAQANEIGKTYISLNDVTAEQKKKDDEAKANAAKMKSDSLASKQQETKDQASKNEKQPVADNTTVEKQNTGTNTVSLKTDNTDAVSGTVMKSVLAANESKKLAEENPAYMKALKEGNKALKMSDSLMNLASIKKNDLNKLKTAQEKQAEQENILNIENIASFKKQLAEKRFAEVNQHEKAYLVSQGKSTDIFAVNQKSETAAENRQLTNETTATDTKQDTSQNKTRASNEQNIAENKTTDKAVIEEVKKTVLSSKLEKIEQNKLIASNQNYKTLHTEATRSLEVADSLFKLADKKRVALAKIKDKKKRTTEEEKISNIENIALFKKQFAQKKYAQLNEIEQEFLAAKNVAANNESKIQTTETKNETAVNKTNETKDTKDTKTQVSPENEKINKDKEALLKNPDYALLIAEAKKHEARADSVNAVIAEKKKNIDQIKSKKERDKEAELIANLENYAKTQQQEADNDYAKANETGNAILAQEQGKTDTKQVTGTVSENKQNTVSENTTAENKNNTVALNETKTVTTLTETEKAKLSKNESYLKIVKEADKNKNISDSLIKVADNRKNQLAKITNAQEKQAEQDQISNIESIAKFKKDYSDKKYNEAAEYGKTYLAANPGIPEDNKDITAENKTDTKNENKNQQANNKNTLVETKTDNTVKNEKTAGNKDVKENKDTKDQAATNKNVNKTEKKDTKADTKNLKETETKFVSHTTYKSTLSDNEKSKLASDPRFSKISADASKSQRVADSLYQLVETKKKNILKIKNANDRQAEEDKIKDIESIASFKQQYADKKSAEADEYGKNLLASGNLADNSAGTNTKQENKSDVSKVNEQNKIIEQNKQELLKNDEYNNLITEAKKAEAVADSLGYLAKEKKNNLEKITDPDKKKAEESLIAELEKTSEFKRQYAEQKFAKANNFSKELLADKGNASIPDKNAEILKASPEEQDKYYKENTTASKNIEAEAVNSFAEADKLLDKINSAYDGEEKQKLQKELSVVLDKIKSKLIESYKIKSNADIVRNLMLEKKVIEMLNLPEIKNNTQIATRYKKDADQFNSMAENARTKAANTSDPDERIKELKKSLNYEQLAIKSNETAIDVLLETKPVDFVSADNMIKPEDNDPYNKLAALEKNARSVTTTLIAPYDKKNVKDEILNKLYTDANNKAFLDKLGDVKETNDKGLSEIKKLEDEIAALKEKATLSATDADKKKYGKRIDENTKKLHKKKYGIAASVRREHEQLYEVYIRNVFAMRPIEPSPVLSEGMKIENQSSENFKKSGDLRALATSEKDKANAVALHDQAAALELLALEQQEKAFGIYMKLISLTVKTEEPKDIARVENLQNNKTEGVKDTVINKAETKSENKDVIAENKSENKQSETKTEIKKDETKDIKTDKKDIKDNATEKTKKDETINKTDVNTNTRKEDKKLTENKAETKKETTVKTETKTKKNKTEINTDNVKAENRLATKDDPDIHYGFNVAAKNTVAAAPEITINEAIPSGIVYRVQIGAFKVPIDASVFKGLSPLACEKLMGSQFIKYLVGLFRSEEAAKVAREEVKKSGYKDAFIVAYKDGVRIPLYSARNASKGDDKQKYSEMAKNEVETLNKNIKEAKNETTTDNTMAENRDIADNKTTEKKKKGKKTIEDFRKEKAEKADNRIADNKTKEDNKIKGKEAVNAVNVKEVKGILYTVQIGVFRNPRSAADLLNLSPIFEEQMILAGSEAIKYTTGLFSDYIEAIAAKEKIVKLGIRDAYVVVYFNGKPMAVNQANIMVMNQGASVVANAKDMNIKSSTNADNIKIEKDKEKGKPVTVVYKVQIGSFRDQVPNDMVDMFVKVAANGGLSNFMEGDNKVYTIGEYKSYEDATARKNKIVEQGIKDAFVIAFRGTEKISIEKAKQLK